MTALLHSVRPLALALFLMLPLLLAAGCRGAETAPDFEVTLFDGGSFRLSEHRGEGPVVVNFWYPSCPPCREEMPQFQEAWQDLQGDGVRFLGLFVPMGLDTEQDARDFVREFGLTFDFATDLQAQVAQAYQVEYFPTTYFIDERGKVFRMEISNLDRATIVSTVGSMPRG